MISRFKTIVIVDDGAALGFTVITAVKWIRSMDEKNNLISKIIIALPVAPMETVQKMNAINNIETVISYSPSIIRFHSLEQYHQHFPEVTDQEVQAVMRNRNLL
jgi:predicted phosphoribosyltransferase